MSSSPFPHILRSCLMALVACALAPSGYGQNEPSFALRITVQDAHHQPVVGADCLLTSAASAKVPVVKTNSDSQGLASLTNLQSGSYTLTVMKEGFESLTRTDILVGQEPEREIAIVLAIAAVTEHVTITTPGEAATSVAAGSNTPAGNLKRDSLRTLPLALARVDEALPLIHGVIRSTKGELSIKGATEQQSALLVNGENANDPATGNFRLNLPIDSVEAVQVFQHPYTGEYGKFIGGLTKIETRRGSQDWHFELNDFLPDFRFKNGKLMGIAEDQPRINFNGPLIKDRLYLSQSLNYSIAKRPVRGLPFPVNETKTESQSYFSQIDTILRSHHTQTFTLAYSPERDQFGALHCSTPQSVTPNYGQRDFSFSGRDRYEFHKGLLESAFSFRRFDARVWGQGSEDQTFTPTIEQGNYFATSDRRS